MSEKALMFDCVTPGFNVFLGVNPPGSNTENEQESQTMDQATCSDSAIASPTLSSSVGSSERASLQTDETGDALFPNPPELDETDFSLPEKLVNRFVDKCSFCSYMTV